MNRGRALIVGFVAFAVISAGLNAALGPGPTLAVDPRVSSSNTQPGGARALYLWLRELGYPTRSYRESLATLRPDIAALAVLHPSQPITPRQADTLLEWVREGGVLLLAPGDDVELETRLEPLVTLVDDPTRAAGVRGDRIVPEDGERWRYRVAGPRDGGAYPYPVREVAVEGAARVRSERGEHSILFARDGVGLIAEVFHGTGLILLFPEASLLTNRGLAKADNVELVAGLIEEWVEPGTEIWFDEYDHGGRVAGSLMAYLGRRRPGLFALAAVAVMWLAVLRWGRALVTVGGAGPTRRRRSAEFVEALGGLYARARAVEPARMALSGAAQCLESGRGSMAAWAARARLPEEDRTARLAEVRAARARAESAPNEASLRELATAIARACGRRDEANPGRTIPNDARSHRNHPQRRTRKDDA